jgi:hypothetical protein
MVNNASATDFGSGETNNPLCLFLTISTPPPILLAITGIPKADL